MDIGKFQVNLLNRFKYCCFYVMEKEIVNEIISALCDRGGFDGWWDSVDADTQKEIKKELEIIKSKKQK